MESTSRSQSPRRNTPPERTRPFRTSVATVFLLVVAYLLGQSTSLSGEDANPPQSAQDATVFLPFLITTNEPTWPELALVPLAGAEDVVRPLQATHAGDGSGRLFIVEQAGKIQIIANGERLDTPFLDISDRVTTRGECGLLSMAFPPDYATGGYFFVYYNHVDDLIGPTEKACDTVIARFRVSADGNVADPNSEERILTVDQPFNNHNGGQIAFGPDGHLYIGLGDGGSSNDPDENAQNGEALLGKMLRIEVGATGGYTIPALNPFVQVAGVRDEIWALGLRNPWRFSFDRATGELYIADVGQLDHEEINLQPASSSGGENYGWDVMEGPACFEPAVACNQSNLTMPIWTYDHSGDSRSITGGYVYRGSDNPRMHGMYLYGDFRSGRVWGLQSSNGQWVNQELLDTDFLVVGFGEDEAGNVYLMDFNGSVYRLDDSQSFALAN